MYIYNIHGIYYGLSIFISMYIYIYICTWMICGLIICGFSTQPLRCPFWPTTHADDVSLLQLGKTGRIVESVVFFYSVYVYIYIYIINMYNIYIYTYVCTLRFILYYCTTYHIYIYIHNMYTICVFIFLSPCVFLVVIVAIP